MVADPSRAFGDESHLLAAKLLSLYPVKSSISHPHAVGVYWGGTTSNSIFEFMNCESDRVVFDRPVEKGTSPWRESR